MPSWYDIVGLERRDAETCAGVDDSRAAVIALMEEQYAEEGSNLNPGVTVLAGFSQGGAVALWTALQRKGTDPLAGTVCMSGYLPHTAVFTPTVAGLATPVLLCHGEVDPVVKFEFALATEKTLASHKMDVQLKAYPDLQHSANLEEIEDVATFLRTVLPR
jgi:predicted esterase